MTRGATFGVRQPCCRASRAHDHGRVAAVTPQLSTQWDHVSAWIPLPTTMTRGAMFGVRQPCCRASRAHDHGRVAAVAVRATGTTGVQRISGWFAHPHYHILTNTVHHRRKPWAISQGVGRGRGGGEKPAWMPPLDRRPVLAVAAGAQARTWYDQTSTRR
ncbi:MAG: hypothetical protein KatS3mg056_3716 [Chloroflexus sp.]|nr:MAG: hypothetical protein KatS3mg056_3716 [Chloroflexus sp.]